MVKRLSLGGNPATCRASIALLCAETFMLRHSLVRLRKSCMHKGIMIWLEEF